VNTAGRNSISNLTRRKVVAVFQSVPWSGDLEEVEFLRRLYDLNALPSGDSRYPDAEGDIVQHRVANLDWDDSWVFADDRFGLRSGRDEVLLRFLSESVHPDVRGDADQSERIVRELNAHLCRDGWELAPVGDVSGYPVYGARKRARSAPVAPDGFPVDPGGLVASMAEILKVKGQARELAVLADSQLRITQGSYDNWNGGTSGWEVVCILPASLYARLSTEERSECEARLREATEEFFRPFPNDRIDRILIAPAAQARDDWRSAANEWLSGRGINNQGRVRSDNIASLEVDGLLFRSEPEINLYRAFKRLGVTFAPLPVFLRGGENYVRLEPDFVLVKDGILLVVEVDGDTYHRESPAVAHRRLLPLDHEGAKIERITAQECDTAETAAACAQRLLGVIARLAMRR
jgi:hypothetical protein